MRKNDSITDRFLDTLIGFMDQTIPDTVSEQVRLCVADYYGCAWLGSYMIHDDVEAYLNGCGYPEGNAAVIGFERKTTMQTAALLNGMMAHVAELDDGHRFAMLHPGSPVISAVLAASSQKKMTEEQMIRGIAAGYEATIRIASAIQPGHKKKGYHGTGTCGTIGAALGIAFAYGYSKEQMKTVLSAAVSDAAGLLTLMDDTSTMKAYNIGRAAAAAVGAAFMGETSFCGPVDALGGERGFLTVTADKVNSDYLFSGIGGKYAIETIYRKLYAACRHCHPAIEAMLTIRNGNDLPAEEIRKITIMTYDTAIKGHDHTEIPGESSAKMSIPYSVLAAYCFGLADMQQFSTEKIEEVQKSGLLEKISVEEDAEMSAAVPQKRCARVIVKTDENVYTEQVDYPRGEPENPISEEDLKAKFFSALSIAGVPAEKIGKYYQDIRELKIS